MDCVYHVFGAGLNKKGFVCLTGYYEWGKRFCIWQKSVQIRAPAAVMNCSCYFNNWFESPRKLCVCVWLVLNSSSLRGPLSRTSPQLCVHGCYDNRWPSEDEQAEAFEGYPPAVCRAHMHARRHTHTAAYSEARLPSLSLCSLSVSLCHSVVLLLDKLLWHCCGFSCAAFAPPSKPSSTHPVCVCVTQ